MKITLSGGPLDGVTRYLDGEEADPPQFLDMDGDVYVLGTNGARFRGDTTFYRHRCADTEEATGADSAEPTRPPSAPTADR
jgi:hypothetical protein